MPFVDVIKAFDANQYDFTLRETQTYEIIEDVSKLRSEIGYCMFLQKRRDYRQTVKAK